MDVGSFPTLALRLTLCAKTFVCPRFPQIIDSIRANVRAKNQRRRTVSSLDRYDRLEEYMVHIICDYATV
jgi:hypothetical protein